MSLSLLCSALKSSAPVAALFGAQYFWVLHAHPLALMGYIACIEGRPALEPELDRIIASTGLPEAAFSNYRNHARLDPQHRDDIYALLDRLPLDDRHHEILGLSAMYTCNALGSLFGSLSDPRWAGQTAGARARSEPWSVSKP